MEKYNEILRLKEMLDKEGIPYIWTPFYNGYHLEYNSISGQLVCSVIEHDFSYSREQDLLEIMGLLTNEELECDNVVGYLSAKEVFNRIKTHYDTSKEGIYL